jgi:hypothetical protein
MVRDRPYDYLHCMPFTGYRNLNSLPAYDHGPRREYSHQMGGNVFYGRQFENRDPGYSYNGEEGPRGRVAPYDLGQARGIVWGRRRR